MDANLYTLLATGFPDERDGCAIEARRPSAEPLYYTWNDIEQASGRIASLLASLSSLHPRCPPTLPPHRRSTHRIRE